MKGSDNDIRSTRRWRNLAERLKKERPPICHICGEDIDLEISGRMKRGWTLDHVKPLVEFPHLAFDESNLKPAHNECNASRGGRSGNSPVKLSRNWR